MLNIERLTRVRTVFVVSQNSWKVREQWLGSPQHGAISVIFIRTFRGQPSFQFPGSNNVMYKLSIVVISFDCIFSTKMSHDLPLLMGNNYKELHRWHSIYFTDMGPSNCTRYW